MGKLYVVATPIGNIEDITMRAIRILKEVDLILCENVSESHRLLKHYDITTPTTNYYSNSSLHKADKIIDMLLSGQSIAMISDAGTSCVSDPGALLIERVRNTPSPLTPLQDLERGTTPSIVEIIPIPGASAITALYSVSGVLGNSFAFYGFIPQKKGRQTFIRNIIQKTKSEEVPIIFYESVHRIEKLLNELELSIYTLASSDVSVSMQSYKLIIGRELTKMHEQIISGDVATIKEYFELNRDKIRGEFVIMLQYVN